MQQDVEHTSTFSTPLCLQVHHRDMVVKLRHPKLQQPIKVLGMPVKYAGVVRPSIRLPPPLHGEHTMAVLCELGLSAEEVAALVSAKVVHCDLT